jgi:hypothetical protein
MQLHSLCTRLLVAVFLGIAANGLWLTLKGSPAHAGYWYAICQGVRTEIPDNDASGAGEGLAAASYECNWPEATGPHCKATNGVATCRGAHNNFSCQAYIPGTYTCTAYARHECYLGEMPASDGTCIKRTLNKQCEISVANPILITTGRKVQSTVDWTSAGVVPFAFTRTYSSAFTFVGSPDYSRLGPAWRSNFDSRAAYGLSPGVGSPFEAKSGDLLYFAMPDMIQYSFRLSGGVWRPVLPRPHPTSADIVYWDQYRTDIDVAASATAGAVDLRLEDGTKYTYDNSGVLVRIVYPSGYTQSFDYSGTLNTRVTDSLGRSMTFEYESDPYKWGLLKSLSAPDGTKISFTYADRLVLPPQIDLAQLPVYTHSQYGLSSAIYPDATPALDTDNPRVSYEYWNNPAFPFALTGIFDERGIRHGTFAYDSTGRAISSQHDGGVDLTTVSYDDANNKATVTNALGRSTVYSYQRVQTSLQRLLAVDGIATANCAASNTVYAYDTNGFRSQAADAEGRITKWVRNARGLPTSTTEGFGSPQASTTTASPGTGQWRCRGGDHGGVDQYGRSTRSLHGSAVQYFEMFLRRYGNRGGAPGCRHSRDLSR